MLAVRTDGSRTEVHDIRRVRPSTGEVLVRVAAVAVDRRDAEIASGALPFGPDAEGRRTLGRHLTGHVAAPGAGIDGWPLGRPVLVRPHTRWRRGWHVPGVEHEGGLAEYVAVPADALVPLPPGVPLELGAALPLAATVHTQLAAAGVVPGSSLLIRGAGSLGGTALAVARALGAAPIIVVDPHEPARRSAVALGADGACDPEGDELAGRVRAATSGRGADVLLHAAPTADGLAGAVELMAPDGRAILAGPVGDLGLGERWDARTFRGVSPTAPDSLRLVAHLAATGRLMLPEPATRAEGLAAALSVLAEVRGRVDPTLVII